MQEHQQFNCAICGTPLVYLETSEMMTCHDCGKTLLAGVRCEQGHYLCDSCHSHSANDWVESYCTASHETDPLALAVLLMDDRRVKMHGPEHHFLVPAVLLTAYYNLSGQPEIKARKLKQARERSEKILGGFCGSHGNCGAGVGTGIFVSLVTSATPLSEKEWQLANRMTARSLLSIAENGGPRCCKRDSFLAITQAAQFSGEFLDQPMPTKTSEFHCHYSAMNRECRLQDCLYFD